MDSSSTSSSRSSHDHETLIGKVENLFDEEDRRAFLSFLDQVFCSAEILKDPNSESYQMFDIAQKAYAVPLIQSLLAHLLYDDSPAIRIRCGYLFHHLFQTQKEFFFRLPPALQEEIKTVLRDCILDEASPSAVVILLKLVAYLGELLLPSNQWQEAYSYMFDALESNKAANQERGAILFQRLIPKCPGIFAVQVDKLSEAFRRLMKRAAENLMVSMLAVGAAVEMVLHLLTPSNFEKHSKHLTYMKGVLFQAIHVSNETVIQNILANMIRLARKRIMFLRTGIDSLVGNMLGIAENNDGVSHKTRELAIEFLVTVAENQEYGCGIIQNMSPMLLKRLFTVLLEILAPSQPDHDARDEDELKRKAYAMKAFSRLVVALRENVVFKSLPDCLPEYLKDGSWSRRYAAITVLGLVADGCSKASLGISETLIKDMITLWADPNTRVRWAVIEAAGQFSKNWGSHFQGEFYRIFLPRLIDVLADFDNPSLQMVANTTMLLFNKNCCSGVFRPHLKTILRNLCAFLQKGDNTLKEAALTSLASLADSFQEEIQESYDVVVRYLNVNLAISLDKSNWLVAAKTIECITVIGLAVGKKRFMNKAEEVIKQLIVSQDSSLQSDDSMRCYLLKAWGRLCRCLGTEFVPYLGVSLPRLLQSAQLSINQNSNTDKWRDKSYFLDEKAIVCNTLCCYAEELTAEMHLWINEIIDAFHPLVTFQLSARVRTAAISAMPLILHSASAANDKGLKLRGHRSYEKSVDIIISTLLDALCKESEIYNRMKIFEALEKCIQISGYHIESNLDLFVHCITQVFIESQDTKSERKKRVKDGLDLREKRLLKEEIELQNNIFKAIAGCLSRVFKIYGASFLLRFDRLWSCLGCMNVMNSTEERTIILRIFHDIAEHCGEEAFKHYEERLISTFMACDLQNPNVWQIVAHGISISAEFGGNVFKPHAEGLVSALHNILKNPNGLHQDHLVAREIAVVALGKVLQYHCDGPNAHQAFSVWLDYLPLKNNLAEAKLVHDHLCTMVEKSEDKILGPRPSYDNFRRIILIFAKIMWAGNNLATDDTLNRMKKLLKRFKERLLPSTFESICSLFPFPIQTMLESCLKS